MRLVRHDPTTCIRATNEEVAAERCVVIGGGAWKSAFFIGLVEYMQERYSPETLMEKFSFCGESAGCLFALALALGVPAYVLRESMVQMAEDARGLPLGAVGNSRQIAESAFWRLLRWHADEDAVLARLRGRFAVTFTAVMPDGALVPTRVEDFEGIDEIFEACAGSSNIPLISFGLSSILRDGFPRVGGKLAVDAGFTASGAVPMLPCRVACYAISCGEGDADLLRRLRLAVDIQPAAFQPLATMFLTPSDEEAILATARHGYEQARAFFESDAWRDRLRAAGVASAASVPSARTLRAVKRQRGAASPARQRHLAGVQTSPPIALLSITGHVPPRPFRFTFEAHGHYIRAAFAAVPVFLLLFAECAANWGEAATSWGVVRSLWLPGDI